VTKSQERSWTADAGPKGLGAGTGPSNTVSRARARSTDPCRLSSVVPDSRSPRQEDFTSMPSLLGEVDRVIASQSVLHCRGRVLGLERPVVMGVLNVTPDSFSDGGRFVRLDAAVARGVQIAEEGAAIIDVGGESTRPGSRPVDLHEELRRVIPVIARLRDHTPAILSVDTSKPEVMHAAAAAGAAMINDVRALRDPGAQRPGVLRTARDRLEHRVELRRRGRWAARRARRAGRTPRPDRTATHTPARAARPPLAAHGSSRTRPRRARLVA